MWLALFALLYSVPGTLGLLAGLKEMLRAARRRRWDARSWAGLTLLFVTLTGRWWIRRLRPPGTDEPRPLVPTRQGFAVRPDGVRLEWEQFGPDDAPALLLSHGWSLTHDTWHYQKERLPPEFRVIVWDMRGEGRSQPDLLLPAPQGAPDYSLETMADDLAAVFEASGAASHSDGCVLVGHSFGAMILPIFAHRHARLMPAVRGLALLAGTDIPLLQTMRGREWLVPLQTPLLAPLMRLAALYPAPFEAYARLIWQMGTVHLALMYGLRASHESRGQDDLVAHRCSHFSMRAAGLGALAAFRHDTRALAPELTLPVLILTGDSDINMPPETQRAMLSRLPQGEWILIPNCGHLNLLECHAEVNDHLRAFAHRCLGHS